MTRFGIVLIIVALLGYSGRATMAYMEQSKKTKALAQTINVLNQNVETCKIRLSDSVAIYAARVENLNMTIDNLRHRYQDLLKGNGIKPKEVTAITEVGVATHNVDTVQVVIDRFGGLMASYTDDFATISVNIDSARTAIIDYSIRDSITVINYQKKHSLLFGLIRWKENTRTVVFSKNPKTRIAGVTAINNMEK
ncbi:hypothetical protein E5358_12785 [Palleniella muris]|uniref:Uncharacterized protein n=1 Tax=Palleniella muris TaxID=3038145 RepID=A0AC61QMM3_9BACT|nr:hypothetical protein [Palleniella muris]TGX80526.1 hypothetical protein E5358_12785 [Palleniella muris]